MKGHVAQPALLGWVVIDENGLRVPTWDKVCKICGRRVRRMTGLSRPAGRNGPVFWHAAPLPGPDDARRHPGPEKGEKISRGMIAANARRKAARS